MPRIRYRRSYDFSLYEDELPTDEREERDYEENSGNSWLSNAVIASQLSESRIKTAIKALKAQIAVLENELLSRRLTHSYETRTDWNKIGRPRKRESVERSTSASTGRAVKRGSQFQKIAATLRKLGIKDVPALLAEWSKIQEKKGKDDEE